MPATAQQRYVSGIGPVLRNINRALKKVEGATVGGLYAAALQVQREAMKRVPVEYGNLRASAYTRRVDANTVEVGFTADYAVYVHENREQVLRGLPRPSGKGVYWGPAGEPRFLVNALGAVDVVRIAADRARGAVR